MAELRIPDDLKEQHTKATAVISAYEEEKPDLRGAPVAALGVEMARSTKKLIERIAKLESEIAAANIRIESQAKIIDAYNSGGFADADAIAIAYLELKGNMAHVEEENAALRAENERLKAPVSDWTWQCNECGSDEYTSSISEDDLDKLACGQCGCNEFHKVAARAKGEAK